jgi:hypothetical protein
MSPSFPSLPHLNQFFSVLQVEAWLILASYRVAVGAYFTVMASKKSNHLYCLSVHGIPYLADFSDCFWPFFTWNINALQWYFCFLKSHIRVQQKQLRPSETLPFEAMKRFSLNAENSEKFLRQCPLHPFQKRSICYTVYADHIPYCMPPVALCMFWIAKHEVLILIFGTPDLPQGKGPRPSVANRAESSDALLKMGQLKI